MTIYIDTPEAINKAEDMGISITLPTLIHWCQKYKIGKKIGGRWKINPTRLKWFLEGKQWELEG